MILYLFLITLCIAKVWHTWQQIKKNLAWKHCSVVATVVYECPALFRCRHSCHECPALFRCGYSCHECPALFRCRHSCHECPAWFRCRYSCHECLALYRCHYSCHECPALLILNYFLYCFNAFNDIVSTFHIRNHLNLLFHTMSLLDHEKSILLYSR